MPPRRHPLKQPFLIIPLYIYPAATAWEPLFLAVCSHSSLDFVIIVNPANGPGAGSTPDENYLAALERLSLLPNTKIIGYVYCSYGERTLTEIVQDIETYRAWDIQAPSLRVDGIFFDEAPASSEHVNYMSDMASAARKTLLPAREQYSQVPAIIIYNPGIFADQEFYHSADYIVVFENKLEAWDSSYVRQNLETLPAELLARSVAIAHSAKDLGVQLRFGEHATLHVGLAGHFATAVSDYAEWCCNWGEYVRWADKLLHKMA
ncbi:Spherulation-specific family 4 [Podospora appendiculata]|uniref:Spherulation-specific family 4 n=1 Tax=Podospora appendiculata TaxID=314037 RepID=A0AAE1C7T2_9PEZI|nr:Spherulation-specific family 4 [Podospora appendiculata]